MTTRCDKKDCKQDDSYIVNARLYKLELSGCAEYPRTESSTDKPLLKHFCYKHRNELAKLIERYLDD